MIALDSQGILKWEYQITTNRYPLVYDETSKQIVIFSKGEATVLNDQGILSGRITYSDYLPSKSKVIPVAVDFPMDDVAITIGELMPTNHHNYLAKNAIQISVNKNEVLLRHPAPIYLTDLK